MADWVDATQALQGYRLVTGDLEYYQRYESAGASILDFSVAPISEEAFKEWWRQEVRKAERDDVALVVMWKSNMFTPVLPDKWLRKIEEEEWYDGDSSPGRIRSTTVTTVNRAIHAREKLTDGWDEVIERGGGEATAGSNKMPAWVTRGVCVELKSNKVKAVIRRQKVDGNIVKVVLKADHSNMNVRKDELLLELPREGDRILVVGGDYKGREGRLNIISGMCANVDLDPAGGSQRQLKTNTIVDFVHLAKIRRFIQSGF